MAANDKRKQQRKLIALSASVSRERTFSGEVIVQTLNLSRSGVQVRSKEMLLPGEMCTLTLTKPNGGYGDVPGRVVWVEREPAGGYRSGIAFRNLSPDEEYIVDLHLVRGASQAI